ncbi:MAG: long-chain fatty acid--CoA ligase [Bacteroidota bacterium]|nr:long-chain fatty acid--CoA ligase [Bacteroidota bacterium]
MEINRVFDILDKLQATTSKNDILNYKENKKWVNVSVADFITNTHFVASALLKLNLQKGDIVAIMSNNRPEWNFVDYGAQQVAIITAPIYPTISAADLKFILNHSEAKAIFISDKSIYQKLVTMEGDLTHLKYLFSFNKIEGVKHFSEFLEIGKQNLEIEKISTLKASVNEGDLYTVLYTSGTTGSPKGVMISHKNMLSNVKVCQDIAPFTPEWRALSFLPLNHVYERFLNTMYLFQSVSIYYAENFETIGDNCREIHPQIFVAVPRIIERVLEKIVDAGEKLTGAKKWIFDLSMRLAEKYEMKGANGFWYELQRKFCDAAVYKKWRTAVGGKIVCIVSGGAALNPRLQRIFACAKLPLLQGYGLTETCVVIAVNRLDENNAMFGTVGTIVDNVKVKIAEEDSEILMKGPSLMLGYYKNDEATKEAIDIEGWFHTGDVGTLVNNKFLKITDRKKEIFKNSAGKYISPILLENKLKENKFIEQCMVVGEGQKFVSAIIIPSLINFKDYCLKNNIEWTSNLEMHNHEELKKLILNHIKEFNLLLAPHEQLKRCELINANWSVETGEITPKLSLKRKVINEKHLETINKIFSIEY